MSQQNQPWEPDRANMGNWEAMFQQRRSGAATPLTASPQPSAAPNPAFDDAEASDLVGAIYKPWVIQRARSQPALMLALRWFDSKAGLWHRSAVANHSIYAIDVLADRIVSLDCGTRQYVIEGCGLDRLADELQRGTVTGIVEYSASIWPTRPDGPIVAIVKLVSGS